MPQRWILRKILAHMIIHRNFPLKKVSETKRNEKKRAEPKCELCRKLEILTNRFLQEANAFACGPNGNIFAKRNYSLTRLLIVHTS